MVAPARSKYALLLLLLLVVVMTITWSFVAPPVELGIERDSLGPASAVPRDDSPSAGSLMWISKTARAVPTLQETPRLPSAASNTQWVVGAYNALRIEVFTSDTRVQLKFPLDGKVREDPPSTPSESSSSSSGSVSSSSGIRGMQSFLLADNAIRDGEEDDRLSSTPRGGSLFFANYAVDASKPPSQQQNRRRCPQDRFVTVNTHTFGRHHNQLQEIMNVIAWADALGRTAVLGYFRANHEWTDAEDLYDFSAIKERYCVISAKEFQQFLSNGEDRARVFFPASNNDGAANAASGGGGGDAKRRKLTSMCFGQTFNTLPFKRLPIQKCKHTSGLPTHYNVQYAHGLTRHYLEQVVLPALVGPEAMARLGVEKKDGKISSSSSSSASVLVTPPAHFVVFSGELAFFLRPGLVATARLFRWLRPSPRVEALVEAEMQALWPSLTSSTAPRAPTSLQYLAPQNVRPFYAIHSRSREAECLKEIHHDTIVGGQTFLKSMDRAVASSRSKMSSLQAEKDTAIVYNSWDIAKKKCFLTISHVREIMAATFGPDSSSASAALPPVFLAADGQHPKFEEEMESVFSAKRAGYDYDKDEGNDANTKSLIVKKKEPVRRYKGLDSMAVDFFLMTRGRYFTGNPLSSVSQNACFMRLGSGLSCDGWIPVWTLYHARSALHPSIVPLAAIPKS